MQLYNTLTQRMEAFTLPDRPITLYVCGITPYDTTHLGHAFTYTVYDILVRYLEFQRHQVRYVQNVTDIDDDILRKAKEVGMDWRTVGNRWTAHFIRDMQALNVRPPDHYPRATDVMPQITASVQRLVDAGVAYLSQGNIYFHVDHWPEFGKLSHIPRDEMLPVANERGNHPDDPRKQDPLDFVLWQAQAAGEPAWQSPWGSGRPGWHIECSTMSTYFLGQQVDLHGGGADLIFPHHECEIAQAENSTAVEPFVRYWLHTAMVRHEGEKMSKSLGNLVMVRDLLNNWSPDALRIYLAGHHYRQAWSHDLAELWRANQMAETLRQAVTLRSAPAQECDSSGQPDTAAARQTFVAVMDNDLQAPQGLQIMEKLAQDVLRAEHGGETVRKAQAALREMAQVFGLRLDAVNAEERVISGWNEHLKRFMAGAD
ncbi:MAG: cysteine--tRNA ligase [Chloroflexi bacterium]|nr:cysteine--tRNA ligase [Chloroflexota bacterium]